MKKRNLNNTKIGIWGFGVVGKSAYRYLKNYTPYIQVLDKMKQPVDTWIKETDQNIVSFFEHNDLILCSPGIKLHQYRQYQNKVITELDIFSQDFTGKTIAITGTLGKTSVTNLIQQYTPQSIAGGNIGYPMLNILEKDKYHNAILELSSFQLQHIKSFAPDIAIWTNFYPNHLDHHKSENEYFLAKCNIFAQQTHHKITLLPCSLMNRIKQYITIQSKLFLFCTEQCSDHAYPTFQVVDNKIILTYKNKKTTLLGNIATLPTYTFIQNWLIIIATLYLQKLPIPDFEQTTIQLEHQAHRLEYLGSYNGAKFYNDSKSTVWQATKQAIDSLNGESCTLLLGGLSKGTDRTPLIQYLQNKPVSIVAFGQEAEIITDICNLYNITCQSHKTLEIALQANLSNLSTQNVLFSPAGASFDLFKNYIERGKRFKTLFEALKKGTPLL